MTQLSGRHGPYGSLGAHARRGLRRAGLLAAGALLLATGACASTRQPSTTAAADLTPHGEPITLGITNQEGSALGSFPELREAAQAAVQYVNAELGGVHGRPLQLRTCVVNGSPEDSRRCTEEMMGSHPIAVIGGADLGIAASMDIYTNANVPYLGGMPITPQQLSAPNSLQYTGFSAGGLPAMALYAADQLHAKKVAIIYPDTGPDAVFLAQHFMASVLRARGATDVTLVAADLHQPDRTAAILAAGQSKPDAILVIEAGAGCTSLMQAHMTLGIKAALIVTANCLSAPVLRSAGAAANGVYGTTAFDGWATSLNGDAETFRRSLERYAPKNIVLNELAAAGFNAVMNIYATLKALPADQLTSEALLRATKTAAHTPNYLAQPYTCDQHLKLAPAVCNFANIPLQVKDGKLVAIGDWIDASQYVS